MPDCSAETSQCATTKLMRRGIQSLKTMASDPRMLTAGPRWFESKWAYKRPSLSLRYPMVMRLRSMNRNARRRS